MAAATATHLGAQADASAAHLSACHISYHDGTAIPLATAAMPTARCGRIVKAAAALPLQTPDIEYLLRQALSGKLQAFISSVPPSRPTAGSLYLIDKLAAPHFLNDGHTWGKRDRHVKLRVATVPKLACYYSKSAGAVGSVSGGQAAAPVERRRYWLLEHKDLVLVHYLGPSCVARPSRRTQPAPEDASSSAAAAPVTLPHKAAGAGKRPRSGGSAGWPAAKRSCGEALAAGSPVDGATLEENVAMEGEAEGSCTLWSSSLDDYCVLEKQWAIGDLVQPERNPLEFAALETSLLDANLDLDVLLTEPLAFGGAGLLDAGMDPFANYIF